MTVDRLDAIVIGSGVEGLFAAAALASAGKHVAILEGRPEERSGRFAEACFVELDAVSALDLVSQGLRFAAPPPIVGVSQDQTLVLWPDLRAMQATLSQVSWRDADALEAFVARLQRGAQFFLGSKPIALTNWHLTHAVKEDTQSDVGFLRSASLARILNEEFSSPLLKGTLAQGALLGCGVSQAAPGSAALLMRQSLLSLFGVEKTVRHVAGGMAQLAAKLRDTLKFFNNADFHFDQNIDEILFDKDLVCGVKLSDGSILKAPVVISTRGRTDTHDLIRSPSTSLGNASYVAPGRLSFRVKAPPAVKNVSAGLLTSGAVIRLNPSLERLSRAHGAFQARQLVHDYCLELQVAPIVEGAAHGGWNVLVTVLYVPATTDEGPWSGNRRERFVSAVAKAIEVWAPGFEASIEAARLEHPGEVRSLLDGDVALPLDRQTRRDPRGLPDLGSDGAVLGARGLWLLEPGFLVGVGHAGLHVAKSIVAASRGRSSADA